MAANQNVDDFKPVKWAELSYGDMVYVKGTMDGKLYFYGPFKVKDITARRLENINYNTFLHYPDVDLFVKLV